jgi:UPF0716 family protein affecting phage T7 exclusion
MITNDEQFRITGNGARLRAPRSGLLGKILTTVASAAVLIAGFMLSLLILATVAAIALLAGGYLWWKMRALRQQMREQPPGGHIIDGEVVRDGESQATIPR